MRCKFLQHRSLPLYGTLKLGRSVNVEVIGHARARLMQLIELVLQFLDVCPEPLALFHEGLHSGGSAWVGHAGLRRLITLRHAEVATSLLLTVHATMHSGSGVERVLGVVSAHGGLGHAVSRVEGSTLRRLMLLLARHREEVELSSYAVVWRR